MIIIRCIIIDEENLIIKNCP